MDLQTILHYNFKESPVSMLNAYSGFSTLRRPYFLYQFHNSPFRLALLAHIKHEPRTSGSQFCAFPRDGNLRTFELSPFASSSSSISVPSKRLSSPKISASRHRGHWTPISNSASVRNRSRFKRVVHWVWTPRFASPAFVSVCA